MFLAFVVGAGLSCLTAFVLHRRYTDMSDRVLGRFIVLLSLIVEPSRATVAVSDAVMKI